MVSNGASPCIEGLVRVRQQTGWCRSIGSDGVTGNLVQHLRYKPYGAVRATLTADLTNTSVLQSYSFTDYERVDSSTGLQYAGARMYDPGLGLFLTRDPAGRILPSPYSYTGGDPVNMADPDGREPVSAALIAIAIGALVGATTAAIQSISAGASAGKVLEAAVLGAAIGGSTAGIGYGVVNAVVTPALVFALGTEQVAEQAITLVGLSASLAQAGQGLADGDVSGIVGLGLSIGLAVAFAGVTEGESNSGAGSVRNISSATTDVEIRYQRTEQGIGVHSTIVVTDPLGMQYSYRAGPASVPEGYAGNLGATSGAIAGSGGDLGWGNLTAEAAPWRLSYDYGDSFASTTVFSTTDPPEGILGRLGGFTNAVNQARIPYNPLTTNSNAFAHQAVTYLGIPRPVPPAAFRPLVQGWDTSLDVGSFGSI